MFYIARDNKINHLKYLQKEQIEIDYNEVDEYGQTPLFYASREGNIEILKQFLEKGANPNIQDKINQQTCLFYACRQSHLEVVKYLVEFGNIDIYLQDSKKLTAISFAKKHNNKQIVEYFNNYLQNCSQSQNSIQQKQSSKQIYRRRYKDLEESKIAYKLIYTSANSNQSREVTQEEFINNFQNQYPQIAEMLLNPDQSITKEMIEEAKQRDQWEKVAKKILNHIWKYKGAYIFHTKVDSVKLQLYNYDEIIKNPMDLGTIKSKLNLNQYKSQNAFIYDMELVFNNCFLYNGENSEIGQISLQIQKEFQNLLQLFDLKQ